MTCVSEKKILNNVEIVHRYYLGNTDATQVDMIVKSIKIYMLNIIIKQSC